MIYQDANGYPVNQPGDGGDSSMRAGMGLLTKLFKPTQFDVNGYLPVWGWMTRHSTQTPWDNPLNCTRDQLIPFLAGMNAINRNDIICKLFVLHILRFGFCQDFERDYPDTWKKPWPTTYVNMQGELIYKSFDFADPLLPNHWWCFIKGAKLYPLYILWPICALFSLLSIYGSIGTNNEQNQTIAELSFHPNFMMSLYTKWNVDWNENNQYYWDNRNEHEYADAISNYVKGKIA